MRRPHGYITIVSDARPIERDAIQCGHCGRVVSVKPGTGNTVYLITHRDLHVTEEAGAFCRVCMSPVCLACHDDGRCLPLEKRLLQLEGRHA